MKQNDEKNLDFSPRAGDRRQTATRSVGNDAFYMRKVGDRLITGVERRKGDRRDELIDTTLIQFDNVDGSKYRVL